MLNKDTNKSDKNHDLKQIENKIDSLTCSNKDYALKQLDEILLKLPIQIRELVNDSFYYKRVPKEFLLSSILFAFSNASGLAFNINCMNYTNYCNLYFAVVGSRGDTKSEAMRIATNPLKEFDDDEYDNFKIKDADLKKAISTQQELSTAKVIRKQLLYQNATIEAMHFAHYENPYSVGMYTDELDALIEKMANKSSQEGNLWRIFYLQGFTNSEIDIRRKTTDSFRLKKSYPTLLGSIQHQFIPKLFANGNLESGFIDRILFVVNLTKNNKITKKVFPKSTTENYSALLKNLLDYRSSIENQDSFDSEQTEKPLTIAIQLDAQEKIHQYSQCLLNQQNNLTDHTKEYVSKMLISIHKIVLLVHLIKKSEGCNYQSKISLDTVNLAILINDFYFTNFKMILEYQDKTFDKKSFMTKLIKMAKINGSSQKSVVDVTGLSRGQVSKHFNKKN
ncbi:DUF3987 domain-containing protein [Psychroserpens burtonensis]|uniref:DUF3987 domain-containing protein n=1 Tax=Psychroserpens burtonensis TaxID=49278 RepID=UPI00041029E5|nr:DUF3987 domain-containing protein [Psychroserpens burtonensis]